MIDRPRIGVLISGGGTNLQAIIDSVKMGVLSGEIVCVLSNKKEAYGLMRAYKNNIPSEFVQNSAMEATLEKYSPDILVLAGYLGILEKPLIDRYRGRILNIHPSLIPKYCGKGFYGIRVHEAVIKNKERVTGATVHLVDEGIDTGEILIQKEVCVFDSDDALALQKRVLEVEHEILIEGIEMLRRRM